MTPSAAPHQEEGEEQNNPAPRTVESRAPDVVWKTTGGKGGLTFTQRVNPKLVIHTTETQGLPVYPYPPHLTIDLLEPDTIWQHVSLEKGAYAMKSASPESPNYEAGLVWQVEHIAYAKDTPGAPDLFYESLAREVVWFHRNKQVPLVFHEPFVGGEGYGNWPGRMSQAEFKAFSGVCGHQHAPSPNAHWDPGALDLGRLREQIDLLLDGGDGEEEGMILKEGAQGNAVKSAQRALNNWSEANKKGFKVQVDGTWGKGGEMTDHVKTFQKSLGLGASGEIDGLTASYLVGRYDPPDL